MRLLAQNSRPGLGYSRDPIGVMENKVLQHSNRAFREGFGCGWYIGTMEKKWKLLYRV